MMNASRCAVVVHWPGGEGPAFAAPEATRLRLESRGFTSSPEPDAGAPHLTPALRALRAPGPTAVINSNRSSSLVTAPCNSSQQQCASPCGGLGACMIHYSCIPGFAEREGATL